MKFRYKGSEDAPFTQVFGTSWKAGDVQDVTDPHAVAKLKTHPMFESVATEEARPAGRPAKADRPAP